MINQIALGFDVRNYAQLQGKLEEVIHRLNIMTIIVEGLVVWVFCCIVFIERLQRQKKNRDEE